MSQSIKMGSMNIEDTNRKENVDPSKDYVRRREGLKASIRTGILHEETS